MLNKLPRRSREILRRGAMNRHSLSPLLILLAAATLVRAQPAPVITSISPASGAQGATISVTLTGANFLAGSTLYGFRPDNWVDRSL